MIGPIEKLTREQFVGIDISDFSIEAIVLHKRGMKYRLLSYSRFRLSPGIVEDGYIAQPDKLKEAINKLFALARPHPIKTNNIFLAVPESKVFSRVLSLPKSLKHKELLTAAETEAQEFIPESLENLIKAIKVLSTSGEKTEVFYAAARRDIIQDLAKVFEGMGINIIGITVEALSSFMGLADELKQQDTLLLDLGARTSIATIFDKQGIRDSIVIPIAGNHITDALVARLNISHTEAEEKKRQFGMDSSVAGGEVMLVIQGQLQPVADELKKFIHYYEESSGRKMAQLVLIGGTAQIHGLDKYFGDNLNLPVALAQSFLKDKHLAEKIDQSKYINALGLARLALQKKWDISFYQTERVDLQQNVTWENLLTWFKLLGKFFMHIPRLFKKVFSKWYFIVGVVLIILAAVGWYYKSNLTDSVLNSNQVFTDKIIIGLDNQSVDNYIPAQLIDYPFNFEMAYPDLTYQAAVKELKQLAVSTAEADSSSLAGVDQSVIPQVVGINDLVISPSQAELLAQVGQSGNLNYLLEPDDILTISANYDFLMVDNQVIKNWFLADLPLSQAEKISQWPIASVQHKILNFDRRDNSFELSTTLELAKPAVEKKWYWPF